LLTYFDNLADRVFTLYTVYMDQLEGHPIPQDITGFQFRLIGDMTVKQFVYLSSGLTLGFIFFSIPYAFFFKIIFAGFFALGGVVLAFIPIEGRSADTMIGLFIKALLKPNEFSYKNATQQTTVTPPKAITTPLPPVKKEEKKEKVFFTSNNPPDIFEPNIFDVDASPSPQSTAEEEVLEMPKPETPQQETTQEQHKIEKTEQDLSNQLQEAKREEQQQSGHPGAQEAHEKVVDLETQLQDMASQKEALEKQLFALQEKLQQKKSTVYTPTMASIPEETEHVKKIPQQLKKATGVPFVPDVPNLITGVVKDPRGNVLPNILVEVKDKDGNPVRAFKTNQLGQFASATPLLNGTYTITFEDPKKQQRFDTIEIVASGAILDPFEVISIDAREDLRKSLFS